MADKQYDLTPEQIRIIKLKNAQRMKLREEYLKQMSNPHRHGMGQGGTLFDEGIQRFLSMRVTRYDHFRPNPKNALINFCLVILPTVILATAIHRDRSKREASYRRGEVSYKDRTFKFI